MVVISINVTNDCSIKTKTVHWLDIKSIYGWGLESGKMRGFPEHFPRFVPNTYIEFYVKAIHCYCLYIYYVKTIYEKNDEIALKIELLRYIRVGTTTRLFNIIMTRFCYRDHINHPSSQGHICEMLYDIFTGYEQF